MSGTSPASLEEVGTGAILGPGGEGVRATLSSLPAEIPGDAPFKGTLSGEDAVPFKGTLSGEDAPPAPAAPFKGTLSGDDADAGGGGDGGAIEIVDPTATPGEETGHGDGHHGPASDFALLNELGRGGMGVVYLAEQRGLERAVALKALLPQLTATAAAAKFASEARVMGRLEHPGIPPVYGFGIDPIGRAYLAMKLVKGVGWDRLIAPRTPEDRARASRMTQRTHLEVLKRVCEAVGFAHSQNVIHRDLKPENIMIGEYGEVLVMDWGLAYDLARRPSADEVGPPGTVVGTPVFLAPEMARSRDDQLGPWTDVYLIGGILYEVLTGTPPHKGTKLIEVLLAAKEGRVEPPQARAPTRQIAEDLAAIAMKALHPEPERRYASAREFADALDAHFDHEASVELAKAAGDALDETVRAAGASAAAPPGGRGGGQPASAVYGRLATAVASFEQALKLWAGNARAREGLVRAHALFADHALRAGDLALAEAHLDELPVDHPDVKPTRERIAALKDERLRDARRRKVLIGFAAAAVVAALVAGGLAVTAVRAILRRNAANEVVGWLEGNETRRTKLETYRRAVALDPDWGAGYYQVSIQALDLADEVAGDNPDEAVALRREAIRALDRAIDLGQGARGHFQRGYARELVGDIEAARADHRQAAALDPQGFFGLQSAATVALFERRYADCVALATRAFEKQADSDLLAYRRGLARMALGDHEAAEKDFLRAAELWPEDVEYRARVSDARIALGRLDEAGVSLLEAYERGPTHPLVLDRVGRAALRAGEVERARRLADLAVANAVGPYVTFMGEALQGRARARRAAGDLHGALEDLGLALGEMSLQIGLTGVLDAYLERAEILAARGDRERAAADIAAIRAVLPDRADVKAVGREPPPEALPEAALAAFERGAYDEVERLLGRLGAGAGSEAAEAARVLEARVAAARGVASPEDRALARRDRQAAVLRERARQRLAQGSPDAALGDLGRALRLDPVDAEARRLRAACREAIDDPEGAAADRALADALDGVTAEPAPKGEGGGE